MPEPIADLCGLSPYQFAKATAYLDAACPELARRYKPACCIAAAQITCAVFQRLHAKARPLVVEADIINPVAARLAYESGRVPTPEEQQSWADAGAWFVEIGARDVARPGGWPGHLVVVLADRTLLDVTLPQCNRPTKGIRLPALLTEATPEFLAGREPLVVRVNGCVICYRSRPGDRTYTSSPDWRDRERHEPAIRAIRSAMSLGLTGRAGGHFPRIFNPLFQRRSPA
jgi:hypothetical protein